VRSAEREHLYPDRGQNHDGGDHEAVHRHFHGSLSRSPHRTNPEPSESFPISERVAARRDGFMRIRTPSIPGKMRSCDASSDDSQKDVPVPRQSRPTPPTEEREYEVVRIRLPLQ